MMDFGAIFKLKQAWGTFAGNHPKVPAFLAQLRAKGFTEGQEIAIAVRYPDGTEFKTGIRLTQSDLELMGVVENLARNMK